MELLKTNHNIFQNIFDMFFTRSHFLFMNFEKEVCTLDFEELK